MVQRVFGGGRGGRGAGREKVGACGRGMVFDKKKKVMEFFLKKFFFLGGGRRFFVFLLQNWPY